MRYKFIYKIDGEIVFQGLLKEIKCKKHDCPNKVSIGLPYCPELSNQPNNDGLFALCIGAVRSTRYSNGLCIAEEFDVHG